MPPHRRRTLLLAFLLLVSLSLLGAARPPRAIFTELEVVENATADGNDATPDPTRYRSFAIDLAAFRDPLRSAGIDLRRREDGNLAVLVTLPMPDGRLARFRALEVPLLADDARRVMPDVRAYNVYGVDDPGAYGRIDLTRLGLRGYLETPDGGVMIDPLLPGRTDRVMSYWTRDEASQGAPFECEMRWREKALEPVRRPALDALPPGRRGDTLRTYRYAIMGTGEYNNLFGGDTLVALAQLATTVNRITVPFERDVAVRFLLVFAKTFPDSSTDPFDPPAFDRGQIVMDSLGSHTNYEMGMLLSHRYHADELTPGAYGGIGQLPGVGIDPPYQMGVYIFGGAMTTPTFYRILEHETGHNFMAWHTWDAPCNRNSGNAYEPGSGNTIMGRAGRCPPHNTQPDCDRYFHAWSLLQIYNWIDQIPAYGSRTPTGNEPPSAEAGPNFTIPRNTPFVLSAGGSDPEDADTLLYSWEQFDQTPAVFDSILGPRFRSKLPSPSRHRWIPEAANVLSGQVDPWNRLVNANRVYRFRLTVRGWSPFTAGGHAYDSMTVTATGAPFFVSSPNGGGSVSRSSPLSVTWTVGGGSVAPTVNILFSEDGGLTWIPLVFATANDGAENVILPGSGTVTTCRIKVAAVGNIFYDVSNSNFTVTGVTLGADPGAAPAGFTLRTPEPNPVRTRTDVRFDLPHPAAIDLAIYTVQGQRVRTLRSGVMAAGQHRLAWDGSGEGGRRMRPGVYFIRLTAEGASVMRRVTLLE